jgi:serine/threonine protein kinase
MEPSSLAPPSVRQLPAQIGRHEVVCGLGEGGMARVFLALQRGAFDATKLVVIKQVRPEFAADQEFLAMFVDEARIALRFNHPNVVHTYEVIAEPPDFCLIMEYLEGQTLLQALRRIGRDQLPLDEHVWILSQVLSGLHYAHELKDFDGTPLGIVHRDVSPSNIFITSVGDVKLLDFGIAKAAGAISFTQQGIMKGKLGYAAPEQCMAQPSDARSDVYAVGVMLWEAIAQRRRMAGDSHLAALQARVEDTEPSIETVIPNVAPDLAAACRKSLARDPERRFANALEFQKSLENYLARKGRRSAAESVGWLLRNHFEKDLTQLRQAIEMHVSGSPRTSTSLRPALDSATPSASGSALRSTPTNQGSTKSVLSLHGFVLEPRHRRLLLGIGGGVACAALGAGLLSLSRGEPKVVEAAAQTHSALPVQIPPQASAEVAPLAAPAARGPRIRLLVSASPARARLRLDGTRIDNPFLSELPSDEKEHELVISADGYEPEVRKLRFEHDLELKLVLAPQAPSSRTRAPAASASPLDGRGGAQPPSPAAGSKAGSSSQASGAAPQPGMDLKKPAAVRVTRGIDEKDPYQQ